MTMIPATGRNMQLMMTLNICLMPLNEIIEINYTYGFMKQPTDKNISWRVTIIFIYQRMVDRYGLFIQKEDEQKAKIPCKVN